MVNVASFESELAGAEEDTNPRRGSVYRAHSNGAGEAPRAQSLPRQFDRVEWRKCEDGWEQRRVEELNPGRQ